MENSTNVAQSDIRRFYVVVFDGISSTVTLLEEERRHCGDYMDESNRNCLCQFHEIPWNQTTDVQRGFTLITRVIT